MPKVVDHESRRREIARAVWRAVGRVGLDAVTVRDIAGEAGYSTGVLSHYFADKDEMLLHSLRVSVELAAERFERLDRAEGHDGETAHDSLQALRDGLAGCLPLDEARRDEWRVWLAFWSRASVDEALAAEQRGWYERWRGLVGGLILAAREEGALPDGPDDNREAELLVALVDGIGLQATLEPYRLPAHRQISLLDQQLELLFAGD